MVVTSMRNGPSSTFGGFTYSTTLSSSGAEVVLGTFRLGAHPALLGGAVEHREIELLGLCVERDEEIEDLLQHFEVALVGAVDLVDRDDRAEALRQRLAEHELGLRHRAFDGIDEDHDAIDHREDALDLAAEIGVAGGIDDVDPRVLPDQRGDLGEDGDAALALEIVAVHRAFFDALVVAERARLLEQDVDQRGLAVVDVGNNRNIAQRHGAAPSGSGKMPRAHTGEP